MINAYTCDKGFKKTRLATQLEIVKRTGKESSFIKSKPDCPYAFRYLWPLYTKILKGCERVGYLELAAFNQLSGENLTPHEVDLIIEIDVIRRNKNAENGG